jgi:ribosomal protein S12 methylthiotransferase
VGFPGEKESHFKALVDFIKEKEFDRLGVFRYSREKGTPAYHLSDQIDEETKRARERIIMEIQKGISYKKLQGMLGMEMDVLVEGRKGNYFTGRTEFDAPEIDGMVYIKSGRDLKPGDICRIRITSATFYDLYGEPLP